VSAEQDQDPTVVGSPPIEDDDGPIPFGYSGRHPKQSYGPDDVRLGPPPEVPAPTKVSRMTAVAGSGTLRLEPDDPAIPSLTVPDGPVGEAERRLFVGDLSGARKKAQPVVGESRENLSDEQALAYDLLVRAALMEGDGDVAQKLLEKIGDDPRLAKSQAAYALAVGDLPRASEKASAALQKNPQGLVEHYTMSLVRVAQGQMDLAREHLLQVARSAQDHAVARHQLGQLILAVGDPARAGTLFEMAMVIAPDFVPPALTLAEMLADSRQYAEAMNILTDVTERQPNLLTPRLLQLRILLDVGEVETAQSLAGALRQAAPNQPEVELMWAEVKLRRGELNAAAEVLSPLLDNSDARTKERVLRLLAQIAVHGHPPRFEDAAEHLEEALKLPAVNAAELLLEAAQVWLNAGQIAKAGETFARMATAGGADVNSLLNGAVTAQSYGLFRPAHSLAKAALDLVRGTAAEGQVAAFVNQLAQMAV